MSPRYKKEKRNTIRDNVESILSPVTKKEAKTEAVPKKAGKKRRQKTKGGCQKKSKEKKKQKSISMSSVPVHTQSGLRAKRV